MSYSWGRVVDESWCPDNGSGARGNGIEEDGATTTCGCSVVKEGRCGDIELWPSDITTFCGCIISEDGTSGLDCLITCEFIVCERGTTPRSAACLSRAGVRGGWKLLTTSNVHCTASGCLVQRVKIIMFWLIRVLSNCKKKTQRSTQFWSQIFLNVVEIDWVLPYCYRRWSCWWIWILLLAQKQLLQHPT